MAISSAINAPIGNRPWRWMRRGVNLAKRPVTVNMSASVFRVVLMLMIGMLWTGFALNIVRDVGFKTDLAMGFSIGLPGIGVLIILVALFKLFRRRRVTFDDVGVTVKDRAVRGGGSWSQPYRAFEGVYLRTQLVRSENGATSYQIIELLHADPEKTIPLYVKATQDIPTDKWEDYARILSLPAITETNGRMVVRRPEELNAMAGMAAPEPPPQPQAAPAPPAPKVTPRLNDKPPPTAPTPPPAPMPAAAPPPAAAPAQAAPLEAPPAPRARKKADGVPKGISVSHDTIAGETVLNVVIKVPRYPYWLSALALLVPLAMIGFGFFGQDVSSLAWFGIAFLLLAGLVVVPDWRSTREIDITRSYLTFTDNMGRGGGNSETIPVKDVENIAVEPARIRIGNELVIQNGGEDYRFGMGLSKDGLAWLHSYLAAAITNA